MTLEILRSYIFFQHFQPSDQFQQTSMEHFRDIFLGEKNMYWEEVCGQQYMAATHAIANIF